MVIDGTNSTRAHSIAVGSSGNLYVLCSLKGTADFDPGSGNYFISSVGDYDMIVCKLDAVGTFQWARQIGGINYGRGTRIAVDGSENVYLVGAFRDTVDFDPGPAVYSVT